MNAATRGATLPLPAAPDGSASNDSARPSLTAFLDELLTEQQRLQTPVTLAARHQVSNVPHQTFRELIPLSAPRPGEQYAFEVDLDACSGCKACVASCHSLNGLDENETWRDVGMILGGTSAQPYQQTVTTACHHCADPGCLNGCPVLAYEKDSVTGIVRHLDDQCIGCQYCVLKCPYDVPKYNDRLGIVRKCDMCHDRLAEGEAPACVQACPTHAIRIVTVDSRAGWNVASGPRTPCNDGDPAARTGGPALKDSEFLLVAPDPSYTLPTTRYVSRRGVPANARAGDAATLRPQPPHWALIVLLIFTQVSVGLLAAAAFVTYYITKAGGPINADAGMFVTYYVTNIPGGEPLFPLGVAWLTAMIGLGASPAHLGQPLRAWRVFLNLRRSWLSREAVVFGGYFGLLTATLGANVSVQAGRPFADLAQRILPSFTTGSLVVGLVGVFCSAMIYVDTRRQFWRFGQSAGRMFGTVAVAALLFVAPMAAAVVLALKLALECSTLRGADHPARLQKERLRTQLYVRLVLGGLAVLLFAASLPIAGTLLWLGGEIAERYLYFRAVDAPKMPGVAAP